MRKEGLTYKQNNMTKKQLTFQSQLKKLRCWAPFMRELNPQYDGNFPTELIEAFSWSDTKNGYKFWKSKSLQLIKLIKDEKDKKPAK